MLQIKRETAIVDTPLGTVVLRGASHCGMVEIFFDGCKIQDTLQMCKAFAYCKDEGFEDAIIDTLKS